MHCGKYRVIPKIVWSMGKYANTGKELTKASNYNNRIFSM